MRLPNLLFFALISILLLSCQSEETKIQNTCKKFLAGRMALDNGDSTQLMRVTDDSLFQQVMLNHHYAKLLGAHSINELLMMFSPGPVTINGNTADCDMQGPETYKIHLIKKEIGWKVRGENYKFASAEVMNKVRADMATQLKLKAQRPLWDSVIKVVLPFFDQAKQYARTKNASVLAGTCDEASVQFIERLLRYATQKLGKERLDDELSKVSYTSAELEPSGEYHVYKFYQENTSLLVQRSNGNYIVVGFNGQPAASITDASIKKDYMHYLRALKIFTNGNPWKSL